MAKIAKLESAKRQLDAAIRMFFKNEDMLAIHTVSRAAFRVLFDLTKEGDAKKALETHIKKVGPQRFNEETNFLKHADQDQRMKSMRTLTISPKLASEWRLDCISITTAN